MNSNAPTLSNLVRTLSDIKVEAYIKLWLLDLNMTLELKHPLKEHQIDQIAFGIIDKYRNLNIADLNLIFKSAKYGEYGDFYDRITVPTVLKWFYNYYNDRCNTAGNQSYQNHVQHKTAFSHIARSSESTVKDEVRKAVAWHQNQTDLSDAQKRIDKVKKQLKNEKSNNKKKA